MSAPPRTSSSAALCMRPAMRSSVPPPTRRSALEDTEAMVEATARSARRFPSRGGGPAGGQEGV